MYVLFENLRTFITGILGKRGYNVIVNFYPVKAAVYIYKP